MVQVLWLPAEVDVRGGHTRTTLVDQLAVLDDGVAVTLVVLQEAFDLDVRAVEELQLAVTTPLQGGKPVEGRLLVAEGAAPVGTTPRVLSVGASTPTGAGRTRRASGTTFTEGSHPTRNALAVLASTPDRVSLCIGHQATLFPASTRKVGAKYEIRALLHPTGAGEMRATEYEWVSYPLSFVNTMN